MTSRIPSLRLHKPSNRAVVTIAGRDHYCGLWGSKQAKSEYERLVGEWLASGGAPRPTAHGGVAVAELVLAYRRFAKRYYAPPSTEPSQIRLAMRPVVERYGHTFARDFGPLSLKAVREVWVQAGLARKYRATGTSWRIAPPTYPRRRIGCQRPRRLGTSRSLRSSAPPAPSQRAICP